MTFREKLMQEHPDVVDERWTGGCFGCPADYHYENEHPDFCNQFFSQRKCTECWNREMPENDMVETTETTIEETTFDLSELCTELVRAREILRDGGFTHSEAFHILDKLIPYYCKKKQKLDIGDIIEIFRKGE